MSASCRLGPRGWDVLHARICGDRDRDDNHHDDEGDET